MSEHNHGVVHFELVADDPDKLSEFYTNVFGWEIMKMSMEGEGGDAYYGVSTGPSGPDGGPSEPGYIGGGIAKRMSPDQKPTNYVNVESIEDYIAKATAAGATLQMGKMPVPGMGYIALLTDPEGNPLGLWNTDSSAQ